MWLNDVPLESPHNYGHFGTYIGGLQWKCLSRFFQRCTTTFYIIVWTHSRVFHKSQNMPCMAAQRMQVVTHYYDHYAKKSEFLDHFPINSIRLKICTENG